LSLSGSFAKAMCIRCGIKLPGADLKEDIFAQVG